MTEHTPGPWVASGNRIYMGASMERREIAVATKSDPSIRKSAEANARLIAAAPDLLAALVDVLPMAEALLRVGMAFRDRPAWMVEQDKYGMDAVGAARAAIARARGEG